jgi:hypothetical protein
MQFSKVVTIISFSIVSSLSVAQNYINDFGFYDNFKDTITPVDLVTGKSVYPLSSGYTTITLNSGLNYVVNKPDNQTFEQEAFSVGQSIDGVPYYLDLSKSSKIGTIIQNNSEETITVSFGFQNIAYQWANYKKEVLNDIKSSHKYYFECKVLPGERKEYIVDAAGAVSLDFSCPQFFSTHKPCYSIPDLSEVQYVTLRISSSKLNSSTYFPLGLKDGKVTLEYLAVGDFEGEEKDETLFEEDTIVTDVFKDLIFTSENQISPNPVLDFINVKATEIGFNYSILNLDGSVVKKGILTENKLAVSDINSGSFILIIQNDSKVSSNKFIKI